MTLEEPKLEPEPMEAHAPENPAKRRLQPLSDEDADDIIETHAGKKARQRLAEIERRIEAVKREAAADGEDAELLSRLKALQRSDPAAFARLRAQLG